MSDRSESPSPEGGTVAEDSRMDSGVVAVNGLEMYYEARGSGAPLVMLHGGVVASEAFGPNLAVLARTRRVVAIHLQGHGHTRDIDRPLRCEHMADDVAAFVAALGLGAVDVLGYSMGAGVALQLAIRHPETVRRLVVVSAPMSRDGWYPEVREAFDAMAGQATVLGAGMTRSPMAQQYPHVDWAVTFAKIGDMQTQDYDWSEAVARIAAPTMLVFADADAIRLEHMVAFYRCLGGGQRDAGLDGSGRADARLCIVPGTTHYDLMTTDVVARLVEPFLAPVGEVPQGEGVPS